MLSPLTPHVAEELWARLGEAGSLPFADFPVPDPRCSSTTPPNPRQINAARCGPGHGRHGSVRSRARGERRSDKVAELLAGATVRKVVVVPGRMVNFVLA
jgi:leucyl-tRNA synthetase